MLGPATPLAEVSEAERDRPIAVIVKGTRLAALAVLPQMLAAQQGAVVTFACGAGLAGAPTMPAYSAVGAVVLLDRSIAASHTADGIRAYTVCFGPMIDMRVYWPNGARVAAMLTFDFDAETLRLSRDPANARRPGTLSQGTTALEQIACGWKQPHA